MEKKYKDEDWLREQYVEKQLTQYEIADKCNVSQHTISDWMDRFDISRYSKPCSKHYNNGYETYRDCYDYNYEEFRTHQLVAIMDGADPHKVFSNAEYHVHHKNNLSWDNRPSNLVLLSASEHTSVHSEN